jgi:NitT/TauT family transport system ATP-binding protein
MGRETGSSTKLINQLRSVMMLEQGSKVLMSVRNLNKTYLTTAGDIHALSQVNVDIYEEEFVCIIGPSGCGKSTLLHIMGGIKKASSGDVLLSDRRIDGPSPEVGVVFQQYAAFPWMTVQQNIEYGPRMAGMAKEERRQVAEKYIKLVHLDGYEHLFPKELSGGMSKRVDIARAYANNPKVLLMDEPFGALDDFTRKRMQEELLKLWSTENKTIVFVTHDLEEAVFLADRIIIMQKNPNTVAQSVKVDFCRPRTAALRNSEEFIGLRMRLSEVLDHEA